MLKYEQALATSPSPSFEEQQSLADRADKDFVRIKQLLEDGRVSRLDAIILNNEFRLIGPERDKLVKNDMATVECDCSSSRTRSRMSKSSCSRIRCMIATSKICSASGPRMNQGLEGENLLSELEQQHRRILFRRRDVLEKLSQRSSRTLQEITAATFDP